MARRRCRILAIEDDSETAEHILELLAASGYVADLAVDGDDGLSRARSGEYPEMTIDRMLPGLDGIAMGRLREEKIIGTGDSSNFVTTFVAGQVCLTSRSAGRGKCHQYIVRKKLSPSAYVFRG